MLQLFRCYVHFLTKLLFKLTSTLCLEYKCFYGLEWCYNLRYIECSCCFYCNGISVQYVLSVLITFNDLMFCDTLLVKQFKTFVLGIWILGFGFIDWIYRQRCPSESILPVSHWSIVDFFLQFNHCIIPMTLDTDQYMSPFYNPYIQYPCMINTCASLIWN